MSTRIEWCDESWNPMVGCSPISEGCLNCYAERMAGRNLPVTRCPECEGTGDNGPCGPSPEDYHWCPVCHGTGNVGFTPTFHPDRLDKPLHWRKPRRVFVNSMSDLFHEAFTDEQIRRVVDTAWLAPQHCFMVLTKRPERMQAFMSDYAPEPLVNLWLGVTAENQQRADERIPHLLRVPGNRFLSLEPLLGPVNLSEKQRDGERYSWLRQTFFDPSSPCKTRHDQPRIHAVLLGGESGPNARPMHPAWAKFVRDQCEAACVPFFFKQWGEWLPVGLLRANGRDLYLDLDGSTVAVNDYVEGKGKDPVRMVRVGKKTAGRLLQGCMHDSLPWGGVK